MKVFISGLAIACGLYAGEACAQDSQAEIARRDMITRAEAARRAGHYAQALEDATRAAQIRVTPSLRLLLAQSHAALGHVLEALDHSRACVREAEADVTLRNRELVMTGCRDITTQMEPRVGRLTVHTDMSQPAGLHVRIGNADMNTALIGVAAPVMPGTLRVHAEADGYRAFDGSVVVGAGESREINVRMVRDPNATHVTAPTRADEHRGAGAGPWVLVGIGGASLAGAVISFIVSDHEHGLRQNLCDNGIAPCDASAATHDDRYRTFAYVGDAALAVGSFAVVTGVLWGVLGRGGAERAPHVTINSTAGGAMVSVGGSL